MRASEFEILSSSPHALPDPARGVEERRVGPERAAVDAEERELADVGVGERLEHQGADGRLGIRRAPSRLLRLEVGPRRLAAAGGRRQRVDDQVEQRGGPHIPRGGGTEDRHELALADAGAQRPEHLGLAEGSRLEVLGEQLVVRLGGGFDELLAILLGPIREVVGDLALGRLAARVRHGLHLHEIDGAAEARFLAEGDLERDEAALEAPRQ